MNSVLFFGSFQEYSATVLKALINTDHVKVIGVVTTPPHQSGRNKELTPNPVHTLALAHGLAVFTPNVLDDSILTTLLQPDFLLTAGYGKLIPESWLAFPKKMAINLHLSLLPDFRGANPAEWGLLLGMEKTGVTLIEMSPEFDTGKVIAQAEMNVKSEDTRETLYERLYHLGGQHLPEWLDNLDALPKIPQNESVFPYASRFLRDDGFIAWEVVDALMKAEVVGAEDLQGNQMMGAKLQQAWSWCQIHNEICKTESLGVFVARASRALRGFPSLWTLAPTPKGPKRLKIHLATTEKNQGKDALVLQEVQLEGQQPSTWKQIKNAIAL